VHDYVNLGAAERIGKTPFVYATDDAKALVKLEVSAAIVHLVEERRKYWRTLRYLAGRHVEKLGADHRAELAALEERYR
ncbi:hypothetical protein J8J40_34675, partial [Mycobacterium tuberculosis]|nr:hypothetical protein [Mycobacterium tuberculosis]